MNDYLAAGPLIAERLRAQVGALKMVGGIVDVDEIEKNSARTPAALVVYDGDRLGDSGGRGQAQIVFQRWLAVLAVRNARGQATGEGVAAEAGPILGAMIVALSGWAPSPEHQPLVRVAAPRPGFTPALGLYPLAFEAQISTRGAGNAPT